MPIMQTDTAAVYYECYGSGFPVLLFAPGGMRSAASFWENAEWNPVTALAPHFLVIAMDQRNAGRSTAAVGGDDDWGTYTDDHLDLLDHLEIQTAHLLGGCIGGPYCMGVIERAPERVAAAVLQQPIGNDGNNRERFFAMFDQWADELRPELPSVSAEAWASFRANMFDKPFLYNVSREFVAACQTPLLVLMGNDAFHPESISREIVDLAPNARLVEHWKDADADGTVQRVVAFLKEHTP